MRTLEPLPTMLRTYLEPVQNTESGGYFWVIALAAANNILPLDFPIIVDDLTGFVCEPALLFLYEEHTKGKPDGVVMNTVLTYADDLKEWFRFCEEFKITWSSATESNVASFCNVMRATHSPQYGKPYATDTINRRKSTVVRFYKWARKLKLQPTDAPAEGLLTANVDFSAIQRRLGRKLLKRAGEVEHVSAMERPQARTIMNALGPLPSERRHQYSENSKETISSPTTKGFVTYNSSRSRLASQIALEVGLPPVSE